MSAVRGAELALPALALLIMVGEEAAGTVHHVLGFILKGKKVPEWWETLFVRGSAESSSVLPLSAPCCGINRKDRLKKNTERKEGKKTCYQPFACLHISLFSLKPTVANSGTTK